jgi:copper homeostasis protein
MNEKPIIEICLESVESVIAAEQGGADRVELCSDLFEGGLTPTLGTFRTARRLSSLQLNVMIRPRGGDFCYSATEFAVMEEDAKIFKEEGADALVVGILNPDGTIDKERMQRIIEIANPLPITFHRAFDVTVNPYASLETLIDLGVQRVLTSGMEPTVMEGFRLLAQLVKKAGDRIIVMPGCGITERNFEFIKEQVKAKEYHLFLPRTHESSMVHRPDHIYRGGLLRQDEFLISHTDAKRVVEMTK